MLKVSQTTKDFLLFFAVAGVIVLSINIFIMIQNQNRMLNNQEDVGLPTVIDSNERLKNIESIVGNQSNPSERD